MLSIRSIWMVAVLAPGFVPVPAHADTIRIVIENMAFSPASVTVKTGDTIEWVNQDRFAHTATTKDGWEVMLPVGKSGSWVAAEAGPVDYFCRFHPNMKGHIDISP